MIIETERNVNFLLTATVDWTISRSLKFNFHFHCRDIVKFVPNHRSHIVVCTCHCSSKVSASIHNPKVPSLSIGPNLFLISGWHYGIWTSACNERSMFHCTNLSTVDPGVFLLISP